MPSSEHIIETIPTDPDNPFPLGWKRNHDPKSADYPYRPLRATVIADRPAWPSSLDTLDQTLGSCVPCTGAEWLATNHTLRPALTSVEHAGRRVDLTNPVVVVSELVEDPETGLYHLVTNRDPFSGAYPPEDTGSDGTSLGNLFVELGWADRFEHAFGGLTDVLSGLQEGTVWVGGNWYSSMFNVTSDGFVEITPNAWVAGGHQFLLDGEVNVAEQWCGMRNHWRRSWGRNGRARIRWSTLERILGERGDAQIVRPKVAVPPFPESPAEGCLGSLLPASVRRRLGVA